MIHHTNSSDISDFKYFPQFFTKDDEQVILDYLKNTNDFVPNVGFKKVSRYQKWYHFNNEYFCSEWRGRFPQWESFTMDDTIKLLINKIQKYVNQIPNITIPQINSCLINKYPNGSHFIAPHRDSKISFGENPTIVILSFGAKRTLNFIPNDITDNHFSFELESGSLFIMSGASQEKWKHAIPESDIDGERFSITLREFISYKSD